MKILLSVLIIILAFVFSIHTLTSINQDVGRHITLGQIIWQSHQVPKTNLFSYTAENFPFINHHWFGEVLLYLGSITVGLKGLIIVKAFIIALAVALAFFAFYTSETAVISAAVGVISIFILTERTDVRPEVFSFLFIGWYLFVLFNRRKLMWTLPLVQLIWVNTHIYFFLGPVIFGLFLIGEFVKDFKLPNFKYISIGLWIGAVNFINPFFWRGALYPLFILKNYGYSIVENQSPFFLEKFGYPQFTADALFVGFILAVVSFAMNYKNLRRNIFSLGLIIFAGATALYMIRNYPIFALILLPVTVKNFNEAGVVIKNRKICLFANIILAALIYSVVSNQIYAQASFGRTFGLDIPKGAQKAVDFVRQNKLRGPMFNNFDIGSFLIWKLPEEKVFIDGRPEAYPADFIQKIYIPMQENPAVFKYYAEKYKINFIFWDYQDITPWSQKFLENIIQNKDWPLIYKDDAIVIFVNRSHP